MILEFELSQTPLTFDGGAQELETKGKEPRAKHIVIIVKRIFKHFVMFCPLPSYTLLYSVHCKIALNFASSILTEINELFPSLFEFDPFTNLTHPWLSASRWLSHKGTAISTASSYKASCARGSLTRRRYETSIKSPWPEWKVC